MLSLRALAAGYRVRLLVRGRDNRAAKTRVRETFLALGMTEAEWRDSRQRIEFLTGDISRPGFGLSAKEWQQAADGLEAVFHAAAYTGFDTSQATRSSAVNIDGTRNVLRLVTEAGARLFHVSTAYVVGDTDKQVFENPLNGTFRWKNPYEKTKFIAEREVHAHCRQHDIDYAVFRPSILTGDSRNGRTIRFNNMYNFIRVAHMLAGRRNRETVIVEANPGARLNIVPIDFAIEAIWRIAHQQSCTGRIFHITNPSPPTFLKLAQEYSAILGLDIRCLDRQDGENPALVVNGRRIGASFSEYGSYMFGEPRFDLTESRTLIPDYDNLFPRIDTAYFRRILEFAIAAKWGGRQQVRPEKAGSDTASSYTDRYFQEFLPGKQNKRLISDLQSLRGIVAIRFRDTGKPAWILELRDGMLVGISQDSTKKPECTYVTDTATFEAVASGRMRPEQVFFEGRGDILGNIEKGLQVITALAEFFRTYPFVEPASPDRQAG